MSSISQSFREWLVNEILTILSKKTSPPPFLIWCDPHGEWIDLLKDASEMTDFELWAPESYDDAEHELLVRERFYTNDRLCRIIWIPVSRDEISWLKIFELEAQGDLGKELIASPSGLWGTHTT